ncbi:MAG: hypothetical protein OEM52_02820 [bacterium]|nr:hypothetical protein [bacterium]
MKQNLLVNHSLLPVVSALVLLITATMIFAQPFPQEFGISARTGYLLDYGWHWDANRSFHPYDVQQWKSDRYSPASTEIESWLEVSSKCFSSHVWEQHTLSDSGVSIFAIVGLGVSGQSGAAKSYNHVGVQPLLRVDTRYHRNWYGRLSVRTTNEPSSLDGFTGTSKEIERAGLKSAEVDESVLGYRNRFAPIEYGPSREVWGPNSTTNLLLSNTSPSYERFVLEFRFKRIAYRYFFAFLESKYVRESADTYQRYLVGRCVEYRNQKNLVIGVGEISLLTGIDRSVDWSFFNPIGVHLEIEQNKRQNSLGSNAQNDILFANFDWLARKNLRISGMFVLDEFQLDSRGSGSNTDALGFWGKVIWTPFATSFAKFSWLGTVYRCDTYTLQHSNPYTNAITRNKLLGDSRGNDSEDYQTGFRILFKHPVLLEVVAGQTRWGDNRIQDHPYTTYEKFLSGPFPSGKIRTNQYLAVTIDSEPLPRLNLGVKGHIDLETKGTDSAMEQWTLTASYYLPYHYSTKDDE